MYNVIMVSKRVIKEMKKLGGNEKRDLDLMLSVLATDPRPAKYHFEQLWSSSNVKRIKVGRLRVFYLINEKDKQILIGKIGYRDSVTYHGDPNEWFKYSA